MFGFAACRSCGCAVDKLALAQPLLQHYFDTLLQLKHFTVSPIFFHHCCAHITLHHEDNKLYGSNYPWEHALTMYNIYNVHKRTF